LGPLFREFTDPFTIPPFHDDWLPLSEHTTRQYTTNSSSSSLDPRHPPYHPPDRFILYPFWTPSPSQFYPGSQWCWPPIRALWPHDATNDLDRNIDVLSTIHETSAPLNPLQPPISIPLSEPWCPTCSGRPNPKYFGNQWANQASVVIGTTSSTNTDHTYHTTFSMIIIQIIQFFIWFAYVIIELTYDALWLSYYLPMTSYIYPIIDYDIAYAWLLFVWHIIPFVYDFTMTVTPSIYDCHSNGQSFWMMNDCMIWCIMYHKKSMI
jgi:hypothetical protein